MRNILTDLLSKAGHTIQAEATDGKELMKLLQVYEPDCIILDINMPNLNGLDALHLIKKQYPHIKVIMCSAMSQDFTVKKAFTYGADGFVAKPFQPETILNLI